jgi:hypothetical protein
VLAPESAVTIYEIGVVKPLKSGKLTSFTEKLGLIAIVRVD